MSQKIKKLPTTKDHHVGIELEFFLPENNTIIQDLMGLSNLKSKFQIDWELVTWTDHGYEAALLTNEIDYKDDIESMLNFISKYNPIIDARCGLHVHLDCRQRNASHLKLKFKNLRSFLLSFCNPERITNAHCNTYSDVIHSRNYPTIEVRLHEGTLNIKKIQDWCQLLIKLANE